MGAFRGQRAGCTWSPRVHAAPVRVVMVHGLIGLPLEHAYVCLTAARTSDCKVKGFNFDVRFAQSETVRRSERSPDRLEDSIEVFNVRTVSFELNISKINASSLWVIQELYPVSYVTTIEPSRRHHQAPSTVGTYLSAR